MAQKFKVILGYTASSQLETRRPMIVNPFQASHGCEAPDPYLCVGWCSFCLGSWPNPSHLHLPRSLMVTLYWPAEFILSLRTPQPG